VVLPVSAGQAFAWHERPGAFERLMPPWQRVEVIAREGGICDGDRTTLRMRLGPVWRQWVAEHRDYQAGRLFRDVQVAGPFALWEHTHRFEPIGEGASRLIDQVQYKLPFGTLGRCLGGRQVRRMLDSVFSYRHRLTGLDLAMHARYAHKPRMKVAITGASGVIGSALVAMLTTGGHDVIRLVRRPSSPGSGAALWDPMRGVLEPARLEGIDAVVHLAGENVGGGRWTRARKQRIVESRESATSMLVQSLARLARPPGAFISASAVGYYGDAGDGVCDEAAAGGAGFLADVCRRWEAAAAPAVVAGMRVALARIGVVITPRGGALAKMLRPFRLGLGGPIGAGTQVMSWISLDDAVAALHHLLMHDELAGPVNLVAPEPVSNRRFAAALAAVLHRPAFMPLPGFAARFLFGQMADEMLLAGARAVPRRLVESGFSFRDPEIEGALRWCLGRMKAD
jgi:uncharacterized protein (TIGR01777 family)